jgi:hypothetical protein
MGDAELCVLIWNLLLIRLTHTANPIPNFFLVPLPLGLFLFNSEINILPDGNGGLSVALKIVVQISAIRRLALPEWAFSCLYPL